MANSIIDDMLKNQAPVKEKKKGSKLIIFFVILLIIILITAVAAVLFLKQQNKLTPKDEFVKYLGKSNVSSVLNLEKMNTLNSKLQSESSELKIEVTGSISSMLLESDIDLSELKLNINSKNNPIEEKKSADILVSYHDNEIISFNILNNNEGVGIFSEQIITKYIGSKYSELGNVLSRISNNSSINMIDFSAVNNSQFVLPQISNEMFSKYIDILAQKVPEDSFSSKKITLERSNGKVDVIEYSMKLTESQVIELTDLILKTLQTDEQLLDTMLTSFGDEELKLQLKEMIKSGIEQYITSLYEETPDDSKIYTVKIYGQNDVIYKMAIDLYGERTIDIDYNDLDNSSSIIITMLENKNNSGYSIDLTKKISDVTENLICTFNIIQSSDIVGKVGFDFDLVNSRKFIYIKK